MTRPSLTLFATLLACWSSTGCDLQPSYALVMTTYDERTFVSTQTVIQGFRSKEKCQFAGDQWRHSEVNLINTGRFVCLEPGP
jgi:hypothetical protein